MMAIVFSSFLILTLLTARKEERRRSVLARSKAEWALDAVSLGMQGFLIPVLQVILITGGLRLIAPHAQGSLEIASLPGFLLGFVGVDYLYYWNHRLLHSATLWPAHRVHHSAPRMDFLMSSRNSVWSSFLILYFWINGAMVYLLKDPTGYLVGIALTHALDLWRHSDFELSPSLGSFLNRFLVTPALHRGHHSRKQAHVNYGANFNLWDQWHGTFLAPTYGVRDDVGTKENGSFWDHFLLPWRMK